MTASHPWIVRSSVASPKHQPHNWSASWDRAGVPADREASIARPAIFPRMTAAVIPWRKPLLVQIVQGAPRAWPFKADQLAGHRKRGEGGAQVLAAEADIGDHRVGQLVLGHRL